MYSPGGKTKKGMDSLVDTFKIVKPDEQGKDKTFDSIDIFSSINKDNSQAEAEEEYRRKTRKRLMIIATCSILLTLLILAALLGILIPLRAKEEKPSSLSVKEKDMIKAVCNYTLYKDSCYSSIYSLEMSSNEGSGSNSDSPVEIFRLSLQVTFNELVKLRIFMSKMLIAFRESNKIDPVTENALSVCRYLISDAISHVNMSMASSKLDSLDEFEISDIRTWLSTAVTDQQTCLDSLQEFVKISPLIRQETGKTMKNATEYTSNSLAIISNMFRFPRESNFNRKLLQAHDGDQSIGWIQRRLLEIDDESSLRPNITVARDGSGDFENITAAVNSMPKRYDERFVIYVKEGEYDEQVLVDSDSWNLLIYGDGMNKTVVSGSLNCADGVATYNSGSFIVEGKGFIAKDVGFKNKAGPEKLQAVALRSSSDESIFLRCLIDGYQDTLYAHSNRQFYRNCVITGTIDFIFGNAAAVFQNCTIQPRRPSPGQYNTVTAQSKSDPNQNTGFSIQQSVISPLDDFTAQTFLGRPWNNYSTTVIMHCNILVTISPQGWIPWVPNTEAPDTIFYAEYENSGIGSNVDHRVTWAGYKRNITEGEADEFGVDKFIQGSQWLIKDNVEYNPQI